MAREDKGSATSSFQDAPSDKSGDQDSTSLAARRARLRGTLSKQIVPPDPYAVESAASAAGTNEDAAAPSSAAAPAPSASDSAALAAGENTSLSANSNGASASPAAALAAPPPAPMASYTQAPAPVLPIETVVKDTRSSKAKSADALLPEPQPFGNNPIAGYNGGPAASPGAESPAARGQSAAAAVVNPIAAVMDPAKSLAISNPHDILNNGPSTPQGAGSGNGSAAQTKEFQAEAVSLDTLNSTDKFSPDELAKVLATGKNAHIANGAAGANAENAAAIGAAVKAALNNDQIIELLNNLDTQIGVCSLNVAQLAKSSTEQLEVVRTLVEVVQNQAFGEIGLSLSSLSESMSAALEPMKAVGELVPAVDNLVTAIGSGQLFNKQEGAKLTPDELVMSLANQLNSQLIDPWTFKCAYMAVFPSEHPADLLRKLVDLLGTQTLSGDLFRAAYDAVQAPDPPKQAYTPPVAGDEHVREVVKIVQDEAVLAQIDELRRFNEELRLRMDQREGEYAEMLAAKDSEVQETQHTLTSRFEEFNTRYEEVSDLVKQRNEMIQQKDTALQQKDSELNILRSQLDEMRDQTHSMVADLQRQLTTTQQAVEEAAKVKPAPLTKAQTNFFEATSTPAPQAPQPQLFSEPAPQPNFNPAGGQPLGQGSGQGIAMNSAPPLPLPPQPEYQQQPQQQMQPQQQIQQQPQMQQPQQMQTSATQADLQPIGDTAALAANLAQNQQQTSAISNQAIPRPQVSAPTTPMMGSGSYGSGVRAQVFEVIVRQALAGAPWREICAGPMQVNNISPDEVEGEVKRRQALLKK